MSEDKPYISPPPDAEGSYKYYLLGNVTPVRVIYNEAGRDIGAEAPDPVDGVLKINNVLLSRILSSPEVEDLTKDEFAELCQRAVSRSLPWTENKPYVSPPPDAEGRYIYYMLAGIPVRVICDESGAGYGAESPDASQGGALKVSHTLLGPIEKGDDTEAISKEEFMEACHRATLIRP